MPKVQPFETHTQQYENWFTANKFAFQSELKAVKKLLPSKGLGMEIGVGSGLFAEPLGIHIGVEPAAKMRELAVKRGVNVVEGVGEKLPFTDNRFDFALMVTTVCFLDDIGTSFKEAYRILKTGGVFLVGFIDRQSPVGEYYLQHQDESLFYRLASFFTTEEIKEYMERARFRDFQIVQTIFRPLELIDDVEPVKSGYGEGSFVVISGRKETTKQEGK